MVDGKVLPFAAVDCDRIRSLLGTALSYSRSQASSLMGRAMARVLAHEIYHILADTTKHTSHGVTKRQFGTDDLLVERMSMDHKVQSVIATRLLNPAAAR